jgi:hypothetical protein
MHYGLEYWSGGVMGDAFKTPILPYSNTPCVFVVYVAPSESE